MGENKMLDSLKNFLENTPKEEIIKSWRSGDYLDKGGLKVSDWLKSKNLNMGKIKVVVYTKADYSESTTLYFNKGLTKEQITSRVNQKVKNWFYCDILKD